MLTQPTTKLWERYKQYLFVDQNLGFALDISRINFHYLDFSDFRDFQTGYVPGTEPLYHFNATVLQIYMSMFF